MFEEILKEVSGANNKVVAYESKNESNKDISKQLGVSESSTFGKIVNFTAGISIDNGWLRLFGGEASENIESIRNWNQIGNDNNSVIDEAIMIGYDVIGGFFAINSGAFNSDLWVIYYYAPDNLAWESLDLHYTDFFHWCLNGDLKKFYESYYWDSYEKELLSVKAEQGFSLYPPLFTTEGKNTNLTSKKIISLKEIWLLNQWFQKQIE
jgi:hypothetical protein